MMGNYQEEIRRISSQLNSPYHQRKVREGKKIVGHICGFVPQELIEAFGAVPLRLRATGSRSTRKAEVHFTPRHCSFVRHLFNQALGGEYEFLEALVFATTCDHARRVYDNWLYRKVSPCKTKILSVPHVSGPGDIEGFARDLRRLADSLAEMLETPFSEEALGQAVKARNRQRRLLGELNLLRQSPRPPVTGGDVMRLYRALASMTAADGNDLLTGYLEEVRREKPGEGGRAPATELPGEEPPLRLLYASSHYEDDSRLDVIEARRFRVVHDGCCTGLGHFEGFTREEGDPFINLAHRHLTSYSCPKIVDRIHERVAFFFDLYRRWSCDGIIIDPLQFCNYWGAEGFLYEAEARKRGIPLMRLTHEIYGGGDGQLRTRVEAFAEQILNGRTSGPGRG